MSELTAIDILIDSDDAAVKRAHRWNARMRESVQDGFELDATHQPHITVGFATLEDLKRVEAEPFDAFPVRPAGLAVYHLGNYGTARTKLKAWTLST
jgi:hypothetical protein